jgi:hypothetical protein
MSAGIRRQVHDRVHILELVHPPAVPLAEVRLEYGLVPARIDIKKFQAIASFQMASQFRPKVARGTGDEHGSHFHLGL